MELAAYYMSSLPPYHDSRPHQRGNNEHACQLLNVGSTGSGFHGMMAAKRKMEWADSVVEVRLSAT